MQGEGEGGVGVAIAVGKGIPARRLGGIGRHAQPVGEDFGDQGLGGGVVLVGAFEGERQRRQVIAALEGAIGEIDGTVRAARLGIADGRGRLVERRGQTGGRRLGRGGGWSLGWRCGWRLGRRGCDWRGWGWGWCLGRRGGNWRGWSGLGGDGRWRAATGDSEAASATRSGANRRRLIAPAPAETALGPRAANSAPVPAASRPASNSTQGTSKVSAHQRAVVDVFRLRRAGGDVAEKDVVDPGLGLGHGVMAGMERPGTDDHVGFQKRQRLLDGVDAERDVHAVGAEGAGQRGVVVEQGRRSRGFWAIGSMRLGEGAVLRLVAIAARQQQGGGLFRSSRRAKRVAKTFRFGVRRRDEEKFGAHRHFLCPLHFVPPCQLAKKRTTGCQPDPKNRRSGPVGVCLRTGQCTSGLGQSVNKKDVPDGGVPESQAIMLLRP